MRCKLAALMLLALTTWPALGQGAFLDPAQAFQGSAQLVSAGEIEVRYQIAPGYYLYRDKFKVRVLDSPAGVSVGAPKVGPGKIKQDENFGAVAVFYHDMKARLPVSHASQEDRKIKLAVTTQGCADAGLCYPPQTQVFSLRLPRSSQATSPAATPKVGLEDAAREKAGSAAGAVAVDETSQIAALLAGSSYWAALLFFFVAGLGLSLTPCILPMIPILSSIIVGKGHTGRLENILSSLAYVLGMATTYAIAGVIAGLTGTLLATALQNIWVLGGFALLFVVLALSMFGFYELQIPVRVQNKLSAMTQRLPGGQCVGLFGMGALSALIVGPCVAAPLAGALLYIGQTGNAVFGGVALFVLALGMGVPLLLVGFSAASLLPRVGPWMVWVKRCFGLLLLATAAWLVYPVLPALTGDPANQHASVLPFQRVRSLAELEQRLAATPGPVMLDFYADWCVSCKEMEKFTFSDTQVQTALSGVLLLQADVTANSEDDKALLRHFDLFGPPGILFFEQGREQRHLRVIGYKNAEEFLAFLKQWRGK